MAYKLRKLFVGLIGTLISGLIYLIVLAYASLPLVIVGLIIWLMVR